MHPIDQFCSLLDATTARDRPLEFYLTESDLHCFLSCHVQIKECGQCNASTVMNMNQLFNLYIRCLIMNLLCKSAEANKSEAQMKLHFQCCIELLGQFRWDKLGALACGKGLHREFCNNCGTTVASGAKQSAKRTGISYEPHATSFLMTSQLLWKCVCMIQSTVGKEHHDSAAKLHMIEIIMKKHKQFRTDPNTKECYGMIWEFC